MHETTALLPQQRTALQFRLKVDNLPINSESRRVPPAAFSSNQTVRSADRLGEVYRTGAHRRNLEGGAAMSAAYPPPRKPSIQRWRPWWPLLPHCLIRG